MCAANRQALQTGRGFVLPRDCSYTVGMEGTKKEAQSWADILLSASQASHKWLSCSGNGEH